MATVFLQVIGPRAFAGLDAFKRQTSHVIEACRASKPAKSELPVRLPGEKGMALAAGQMAAGVELCPAIMSSLAA